MIHTREDCVERTISLMVDADDRKTNMSAAPPIYVTLRVKSKDAEAVDRLVDRLRTLLTGELEKV